MDPGGELPPLEHLEVHGEDDPGFVDTVLGSRAVVASIRLAVIFAGVFVVLSVVALIARGQWLTKVGPVEVSERVSDLKTENRRLEKSLAQARNRIGKLRQEITEYEDLVDWMSRTWRDQDEF